MCQVKLTNDQIKSILVTLHGKPGQDTSHCDTCRLLKMDNPPRQDLINSLKLYSEWDTDESRRRYSDSLPKD